ncbi:hypothetical protein J4444_04580 [Candidatus Woesearchaeota archaeon]|nr:hypothetical protein [Candidatus Woesearchaeota archaeon]
MVYSKLFFMYLGIILAIIGYTSYFYKIFTHKTKPHAFSWFLWALLPGIAFAVQVSKHAGAGAWVTGISALICFVIFLLSLWYGQRKFSRLDWLFLGIALVALIWWQITNDPTLSIILVSLADAFGFIPTIQKSYSKPDEESVTLYALSFIKWIIALLALESYSLATWLYPASLVLTNGIFVSLVLIRRKQLSKK